MDDGLVDWSRISERFTSTILIGNGASRNISSGFSYRSLLDAAELEDQDVALFDAFETSNFERVLDCLRIGQIVCRNVGQSTVAISNQYRRVRRAMVRAVAEMHVPWEDVPDSTLVNIRRSLRHYRSVFTTNYDLLIYWAIMTQSGQGFLDYFWGSRNAFDLSNTSTSGNRTRVLYLHGGLHLIHDADGSTRKRVVSGTQNLLAAFLSGNDVPLIVSEGTSNDKLAAIRRSDYLSFAYESLTEQSDDVVMFGHRLGSQDRHIRAALQGARTLAVSIRPGKRTRVEADKAHYVKCLPRADIVFFDSSTHPLGDPDLRLE